MGRQYARGHKTRSRAQQTSLSMAWEARDEYYSKKHNKENIPLSHMQETIQGLQNSVTHYKEKSISNGKRFWNEKRKNDRARKASAAQKVKVKKMKKEGYQLRADVERLSREVQEGREEANTTVQGLQEQIQGIRQSKRDLQRERNALLRRCHRAIQAKSALKKCITRQAKNSPTMFRLMQKGVYTSRARALARYMVSTGTAESKVGTAIKKIGDILNVKVDRIMDKRTVGRAVKESGVAADTQIIRDIGKRVFDGLAVAEQERLTCFVRTGCCMHKDLNTVKGGDKSMQTYWTKNKKTPPILLANKDNAAILATRNSGSSALMTTAEKRAEDISKRGGSHATLLGGMICRNKDKKKGQQDTYSDYMAVHVGYSVPYPDVSNTRYGSHGEAAATIITHKEHFVSFMEFVRDAKEKPGHNHIEKNFYNAIRNTETITELCVLGFYNVAISRPFMKHVRKHDNILELRSFFEQKIAFMQSIIADTKIWTGKGASYKTACLDGQEWDDWSSGVIAAVQDLAPQLPDLDGCVVAFLEGANTTFSERFSDEFKEGGDIDKMTVAERETLFFSSTNDANEGALGSWRLEQRRRPRETLHKFNARFMTGQNNTEEFVSHMLTEDDQTYLRKVARERDAGGLQRKLKLAQIEADKEKVADNHAKESRRQERRHEAAAKITETGRNLVLDSAEIDKLKLPELVRQLDFHREEEKKVPNLLDSSERVPLKTKIGNKSDHVVELRKAVVRYLSRGVPPVVSEAQETRSSGDPLPEDDSQVYESDYNDDLI